MCSPKTAEPIEMRFGVKTWVGPRYHVLEEGRDPPREGALLRGSGLIQKHCISELCKNVQHTDGKLLPSAIYSYSS